MSGFTPLNITQPDTIVKSLPQQLVFPGLESVIHYKVDTHKPYLIEHFDKRRIERPYGVSSSYRVLSKALFIKKYDLVRDSLKNALGLTTGEREAALGLLRFWAYYGQVYPKASQLCDNPGCSKATYWRAVRKLQDLGLIQVFNRYIIRPHAQISNLYRFDKLLIIIARYLAEHGQPFYEKWLDPYLGCTLSEFWVRLFPLPNGEGPPECLPLGPLLG